jgi:hypothetical protein
VDELEVEPAERGEDGVETGRVVALRGEVTVAVPHHLEVEKADDVERAESRAQVAGAGALHHVQHVQAAGIGKGRGALVRVAGERPEPLQLGLRDIPERHGTTSRKRGSPAIWAARSKSSG